MTRSYRYIYPFISFTFTFITKSYRYP